MAKLNSIDAIRNDIHDKVFKGVSLASKLIIEDAQNRAGEFYGSYSPKIYERTYGLKNVTEISATLSGGSNGIEGFSIELGYDGVDMTNPNKNIYNNYSDDEVVQNTMYGNHGDFFSSGAPDYIFYDNGEAYGDRMKKLYDGLISAGLPLG